MEKKNTFDMQEMNRFCKQRGSVVMPRVQIPLWSQPGFVLDHPRVKATSRVDNLSSKISVQTDEYLGERETNW